MYKSLLILWTISLSTCGAYLPFGADWVVQPSENVCGGYYLAPNFLALEPDSVQISADNLMLTQEGTGKLDGSIIIRYPETNIYADHAKTHYKDNKVTKIFLNSNILLEKPQARIYADTALVEPSKEYLEATDISYRFYQRLTRGQAEKITIDKNLATLKNATYSTCSPKEHQWNLSAKEIVFDSSSQTGSSYHTKLHLFGLPVFYSPYLSFATSELRKSGLLSPNISYKDTDGLTIFQPFYFDLAPNYDVTYTIGYLPQRGALNKGQFRFLSTQAEFTLDADWIFNDCKFNNFKRETLAQASAENLATPQYQGLLQSHKLRGSFVAKLDYRLSHDWKFFVDWSQTRDDNYLSDYANNPIAINKRQLKQSVGLTRSTQASDLSIKMQQYQTLQPFDADLKSEPYALKPGLHHELYDHDTYWGAQLGVISDYGYFVSSSEPDRGNRLTVNPELSFELPWWQGTITPRVKLNNSYYHTKLLHKLNVIPEFDLDFQQQWVLVSPSSGLKRTLQPRFAYQYIPHKKQDRRTLFDTVYYPLNFDSLFTANRFAGFDRVGDTNHFISSVNYTTKNPDDLVLLDFTVANFLRLSAANISTCTKESCLRREKNYNSKYASFSFLDFNSQVSSNLLINARTQWAHRNNKIENYNLNIEYANALIQAEIGLSKITGSNYNQERNFTSGLALSLTHRWQVLNKLEYDVDNKKLISMLTSINYESCCLATRLGIKRYVAPSSIDSKPHYNHIISLQVIFKELSKLQTGQTDIFDEVVKIKGFTDNFGNRT